MSRHSPAVAMVLLITIVSLPIALGLPSRRLCGVPSGSLIPSVLHARHAVQFYAAQFPNVSWSYQMLGDGNFTTKNFVRAWAATGINACDALIGPGFSFLAVAMSPIVEVPWLDASATSTELSDKQQHPSFSRVVPTDEVGANAAAVTLLQFGWKTVSVFCVDDAYGRSVVAGVSAALSAAGGRVAVQHCLPGTSTEERVTAALRDIAAGPTRVVFVGMLPDAVTSALFFTVVKELNLDQRLVFFFAEAICSLVERPYTALPGSLCATYTMAPAIMDPFLQSYFSTRDIPAIQAELTAMGLTDPLLLNVTDIYAQLTHDATYHMMAAMSDYVAKGSVGDEALHVRQFVSEGATGEVVLDANGDRIAANTAVFNVAADGTEVTIGTVTNGTFEYLATNPATYLLGQQYFPGESLPRLDRTSTSDATSETTTIVIAVLVAVAVLLLGMLLVFFLQSRRYKRLDRDNDAAPKDAAKPFTIVFTDIQGSTTLWARAPEEASDAVAIHHEVIRQSIAAHHGYEVKTIGDAFMVAFTEAKDALKFSVEVQERLYSADWGPGQKALDSMYRNLISEHYGAQAAHFIPSDPKQYDELWAGLRVRIGMHFGFGEVKLDNITLGYDYYGTVVNTAARVEAVGHGGQICVTSAFLDEVGGALTAAEKYGVTATDLEEVTLRGLTDTTHLYQLVPVSLKARVFPSLRLDAESLDASAEKGAVHMDEEGVSLSSGSLSKSTRRKEEEEGRSVSRRSTAYEGGSSNIALEAFAARIVRQSGLLGVSADTHVERIIEAHTLVRAMLSTMRLPQRDRVIREVATKWRVEPSEPATHRPSGHRAERAFDETLVLILARTIRSLETQQQQHQHAAVAAMFQPAPPSLLEPIDPEPVADTPSVSVHRDETMILSAADGVSLHRREDTPTQGE